jgi:cytochrome P450
VQDHKQQEEAKVTGEIAYEAAKPLNSMPGPSFWKLTWDIIKDPGLKLKMNQLSKDWFHQYGPAFVLNVPGLPSRVNIMDPESVQVLLAKDGKYPIEMIFNFWVYYRNNIRKDMFPETGGLLGNHGEEWWRVRSLVQKDMLRPRAALFYLNDLDQIALQFCELMESESNSNMEVDNVTGLLYRWSLESVSSIFLDARLNCLENFSPESDTARLIESVNIVLGEDASDLVIGPPVWKYVSTPAYRRFDKASTEIYNICKELTNIAVQKLQNSSGEKRENLSVLEKMIRRVGPDSQIPAVMAMDAIMAGIDTTGNAAAFLLYDLATNPEVQEQLHKEIQDVIGKNKEVTESDLKRMRYLKACVHESRRLKPAVPGFNRETTQDMVLGGYQIPRGTLVTYWNMLAMTDEKNFSEPEKFMPDRWLRGCPGQHTAHPFAAIPFSFGPRMCIGRRFAELEVYMLAIKVVQRFRLEYHHEPVGMAVPFVCRPDRNIKMKFIPRY